MTDYHAEMSRLSGLLDDALSFLRRQTVELADARRVRDLAEGMRQAGLEAVRSRRAQISALQSLLSADRSEMEIARTGPVMQP